MAKPPLVDETDRMVPGCLVRRDRRRRRPQHEVLRSRNDRVAGRFGSADRDERVLRTPGRAPRAIGGTSRAKSAMPVPRLAVEPARVAMSASPTRTGRTGAAGSAPTRWWSATSRSTSGTTSRAATPFFDAPDVFASFADGSSADDYYPQQRLFRAEPRTAPAVRAGERRRLRPLQVRPQHADRADLHPARLRRADFVCGLHHHLRRRRPAEIDDVKSGVEAINGGLGIAVTKSWGMIDNRTISAITPVDESHVRRPLHGLHRPDPGQELNAERAEAQGHGVRRGSHPAVHPGRPHLVAPALLRSARSRDGGVRRFHRDPQVGHAVLPRRQRRHRRRTGRRETRATS